MHTTNEVSQGSLRAGWRRHIVVVTVSAGVIASATCAVCFAQQRGGGKPRAYSRQRLGGQAEERLTKSTELAGQAQGAIVRGNAETAERLAREALTLDPRNLLATYALGRSLEAQGRGKEALVAYRAVANPPEGQGSTLQNSPGVLEEYVSLSAKYGTRAEASEARARLAEAYADRADRLAKGGGGGAGIGYETERDRAEMKYSKQASAEYKQAAAYLRRGRPVPPGQFLKPAH